MTIENFHSDSIEERVGNPGSVVAVLNFSELVDTDFIHCDLVSLDVILNGNLGRHSAHGGHLAPEKIKLSDKKYSSGKGMACL